MTTYRSRQFAKEDLSKLLDAEPRFEEFLAALNQQSKALESILNKGVGSDNLNRQVVELDVNKSQTYPLKFAAKVTGRPIGVRVLRAVKTTTKTAGEPAGVAFHVDWSLDGATVLVDGLPGLSSSEKYHLTLEVVGS